jgi:uncharacterized alkaline shock family protein YloU
VGDFVDSLLHSYQNQAADDIKGIDTSDAQFMEKLSKQAEDFSKTVMDTIIVDPETETQRDTDVAVAVSYQCI